LDEQQFVTELIKGDEQAFRKLVKEYKDQVYNTCIGLLRNAEDAEDTAQEVFIEVHNSIDTFNGESSLSTWIYRIAVNKSLELIRYRKRKKRFAYFKALMNFDGETDEIEDFNGFVHPGIELENKERAKMLMDAIGRLPESQKVAFTLHKIEGLSYKNISEVMEKSLSAIESLIYRARQNLKDDLYDYYKEEGS